MRTPEVTSIEVVLDEDKKNFRLPDGSLAFDVLADSYGSWMPYHEGEEVVGFEREIDTPFVVWRKNEYYDNGVLAMVGGQDSYRVVEGLRNIPCNSGHLAFMHAIWFEPGDVISFVRTPSAYELQQRILKLNEGRR
jgi:hypothetical protein